MDEAPAGEDRERGFFVLQNPVAEYPRQQLASILLRRYTKVLQLPASVHPSRTKIPHKAEAGPDPSVS
jgi:hypothetical protein